MHFRFCPYRSRAAILMTSLLRPTRQFRLATSLLLLKGTLYTQKTMLPLVAKICLQGDMQWRRKVFGDGGGGKIVRPKAGNFFLPPPGRANFCPPRGGQKLNMYLPSQNFRLGGLGSVVSSPNGIRGEASAENNSDG